MQKDKKQAFLLSIFITIFVICASILGWQHVKSIHEENLLKQLAQTKQVSEDSSMTYAESSPHTLMKEVEKEAVPIKLEQYEELSRQNVDMIGWIKIDGTEIDYPVMYTGDDFYLSHNFNKEVSKGGTPFVDKRCMVAPFGTNTILYGHNMKNGTMFSGLLNYKNPDYYTGHPIIRFDTLYETQEYEIVAAFESEVYQKNDTVFKHYNFLNADSQAAFEEYAVRIKALSLYDTGVSLEYGDELITLMTCSYHTENGRFVVVAKKDNG